MQRMFENTGKPTSESEDWLEFPLELPHVSSSPVISDQKRQCY